MQKLVRLEIFHTYKLHRFQWILFYCDTNPILDLIEEDLLFSCHMEHIYIVQHQLPQESNATENMECLNHQNVRRTVCLRKKQC